MLDHGSFRETLEEYLRFVGFLLTIVVFCIVPLGLAVAAVRAFLLD